MAKPLLTLTTDFGAGSAYVAQVKGALLSAAPEAVIVDVAHDLRPFAIADAELLLRSTAFAFPLGTTHIVVVDPGVGGARRPIAVQVKGMTFVGPDNGSLGALATHSEARVVVLDRTELHRRPTAPTFHGRDIFAPVAAELAMGLTLDDVGTRISDAAPSTLPAARLDGDTAHGVTLAADRYGNLTTNIPARYCGAVEVLGALLPVVRTYAEADNDTLVALAGSDGYVELAMRERPLRRGLETMVQPSLPGAVEELLITGVGTDGEGIARLSDGRVAFVLGCLPGDRVRARITSAKARIVFADVVEVVAPSSQRVASLCDLERCSGCPFKGLSYHAQCDAKTDQLLQAFARIAKVDAAKVFSGLSSAREPWHYRHRARLHARYDGGVWRLGYFARGSHDLVAIDACPVLWPETRKGSARLRRLARRQAARVGCARARHCILAT